MNDPSDHPSVDHPAIVRLRAELDAAWKGIGALGQMEGVSRDRVVAELRSVAGLVLTWPVNVPGRARELVRMGVDGLISDRAGTIARVAAAHA